VRDPENGRERERHGNSNTDYDILTYRHTVTDIQLQTYSYRVSQGVRYGGNSGRRVGVEWDQRERVDEWEWEELGVTETQTQR
jgi:hypothetical protein